MLRAAIIRTQSSQLSIRATALQQEYYLKTMLILTYEEERTTGLSFRKNSSLL